MLTPNVILWGRDAYPVEDIKNSEAEKLMKMSKRLEDAKAHVWKRWKTEYVHSLMESHRMNKETATTPKVGEIVLVVGDEKNRSEWKKGKVVRLVQGKDGVVRGVALFRKGHTIERPLQLVFPLEIRAVENTDEPQEGRRQQVDLRSQRIKKNCSSEGCQENCRTDASRGGGLINRTVIVQTGLLSSKSDCH